LADWVVRTFPQYFARAPRLPRKGSGRSPRFTPGVEAIESREMPGSMLSIAGVLWASVPAVAAEGQAVAAPGVTHAGAAPAAKIPSAPIVTSWNDGAPPAADEYAGDPAGPPEQARTRDAALAVNEHPFGGDWFRSPLEFIAADFDGGQATSSSGETTDKGSAGGGGATGSVSRAAPAASGVQQTARGNVTAASGAAPPAGESLDDAYLLARLAGVQSSVTAEGGDAWEEDFTASATIEPFQVTMLPDPLPVAAAAGPSGGIDDVAHPEGDEGTTEFVFVVNRPFFASSDATIEISYETADQTARVAENDYEAATGTLVFQPNDFEAKTVTVLVYGDTDPEGDETFLLHLSWDTSGFPESLTATGTIQNDDVTATIPDGVLPAIADTMVPGNVGGGAGAAFGADGQDPGGMAMNGPGVRYHNGEVFFRSTDLASASQGNGWGFTRFYANNLGFDADWVAGTGWVVGQMPFLVESVTDDDGAAQLVAISGPNNIRWFDRTDDGGWQVQFFLPETLAHAEAEREFVLADSLGNVTKFHDFSAGVPLTQQGKLKAFVDPAGHETQVVYEVVGSKPDPEHSGASIDVWQITRVIRAAEGTPEEWSFTYQQGAEQQFLITSVTLSRGGQTVRQASYSYYGASDPNGRANDLMMVAIANESGTLLDREYYRYYTGQDGLLKTVVRGANYARALGNGLDPQTLNDAQLQPYANQTFTYDAQKRVTETRLQGAGDSSATDLDAGGVYRFVNYERNEAPAAAGDYNHWVSRVTEIRPNGSQLTVYTNLGGAPLLKVLEAGGQTWRTFNRYDDQSRLVWSANPSAVSGFDEAFNDLLGAAGGNYQFLHDDQGLVTVFTYDAAGYLASAALRHGELGTDVLQAAVGYTEQTAGDLTVRPVESRTVYRNDDGSGAITTSYVYADWTNLQPRLIFTDLPVVTAAQNGPGEAVRLMSELDAFGRQTAAVDGDGFRRTTEFDPTTGTAVQTVVDAGGLNLTTLVLALDNVGRPTRVRDANGNETLIQYDENDQLRTVTTTPAAGPVRIVRENRFLGYTETLSQDRTTAALKSLTREWQDHAGRTVEQNRYFYLDNVNYSPQRFGELETPALLADPTRGNYYRSDITYDSAGRQSVIQNAVGTLTKIDYDLLNRPVQISVGTSLANLTVVQTSVYDNGLAGDSNLTAVVQHPSGKLTPGAGEPANRVTLSFFDWRNRLTATKSGAGLDEASTHPPILVLERDNLGRVVRESRYDGTNVSILATIEQGGGAEGVPLVPVSANLLRGRTETLYDEWGRAFRSLKYDVSPVYDTVGAIVGASLGAAIVADTWFDKRGNAIKVAASGQPAIKRAFDGAGRLILQFISDGGGDSSWQDAANVVGDVVLEQTESQLDANGNAIFVTSLQRDHNAAGTGLLDEATARVSYAGNWFDALNRLTTSVDFGTNGGAALAGRPLTPPTRATADGRDPFLRIDSTYDAAGWLFETFDPRNIRTVRLNDALGRVTTQVEAATNLVPTESSNRTTRTIYDGLDHVRFVTAVQPGNRPAQTTEFEYGTADLPGSLITSNDLLTVVKSPNKKTGKPSELTGDQTFTYYNALGERIRQIDERRVEHRYTIDTLGRQIADELVSAPSSIDGRILAIQTRYDSFGRADLFTSIGNGALDPGNAVLRQYNGFGQVIAEYQQTRGVNVNVAVTPVVRYVYGSAETGSRLQEIAYPGGRAVTYNYAPGLDDRIGRVSFLSDNRTAGGVVESYRYLGLGTVVERTRPEAGITLSYVSQPGDIVPPAGDGGDQYTGLDRFGRIVDQWWFQGNAGTTQNTLDRFQYGYDANSNPLFRRNVVNHLFDELYHVSGASAATAYDAFNRLTHFERGLLSTPLGAVRPNTISGTALRTQDWTLDVMGNWLRFEERYAKNLTRPQQNDGTRTNTAAEKFDSQNFHKAKAFVGDDSGAYTAYKQNGVQRQLSYDAWGRLGRDTATNAFGNGSTSQSDYRYDALGRIIELVGSGPAPTSIRTIYYSVGGQAIEEQTRAPGGLDHAYRESVYGAGGSIAVADFFQGTTPVRSSPLQDANGNVTSLVVAGGANGWQVGQRFLYDPYGLVSFVAANFLNYGKGDNFQPLHNWEFFYRGQRLNLGSRLYVHGARAYDPYLGRNPQHTPAVYSGGGNGHEASGSNPLTAFAERIEEQPLWLLAPGVLAAYMAADALTDEMARDIVGYQSVGYSEGTAVFWTFVANAPVLSSGLSLAETIEGRSLRGGDFGRPLGGWDYAIRGVGIAIDVVAPLFALEGSAAKAGTARAVVYRNGVASSEELTPAFRGDPFAFGHGPRQARVEALVDEAAKASGHANRHSLVDAVYYDFDPIRGQQAGSPYFFATSSGHRYIVIDSATFGKSRAGQLIAATHEFAHAEHFGDLVTSTGSLSAARTAFFIPDTTTRYALRELYTEGLAASRVSQHLGGLTPQELGHSTRYISSWLTSAGLSGPMTIRDFM